MRSILLPTLALLGLAAPAAAHHSSAMFDQAKTVTLQGSIVSFDWTNPHAWIEIAVPKADGAADRWSVEMTSPNTLVRQGWKRTSYAPGDKATIIVHPLRDGKNGGQLFKATLPDGTVLGSATGAGSSIATK